MDTRDGQISAPSIGRRWNWVDWLLLAVIGVDMLMLAVVLAWPAIEAFWYRPRPGAQVARHFVESAAGTDGAGQIRVDYLLYLPSDYTKNKVWPLVIFLHGAGERGHDLNKVRRHGLPALVDTGPQLPCLVVSPQCAPDQGWVPGQILSLIDHVCNQWPIDSRRIYLMGYSMGGFGTWRTAAAMPDRFAAIVPIAGGGDPQAADRLVGLPIWAFHGDADEVVLPKCSQEMVDAVRAAGGDAKLTLYKETGHGIIDRVCAEPELWHWLLARQRPTRSEEAP